MAPSKIINNVAEEGTTFVFGSWVCTANGPGGFNSHLTNPNETEAHATTHRNSIDEFVDQLDEIVLPVHVKNKGQPDLDETSSRSESLSELEEDLNSLL